MSSTFLNCHYKQALKRSIKYHNKNLLVFKIHEHCITGAKETEIQIYSTNCKCCNFFKHSNPSPIAWCLCLHEFSSVHQFSNHSIKICVYKQISQSATPQCFYTVMCILPTPHLASSFRNGIFLPFINHSVTLLYIKFA